MVVNYRAADHVVTCVAGLHADGITDIVVVDNASADGGEQLLRATHPSARWVGLARNLGYGAAANRGVALTTGEVVLICNPDLLVSPGTSAALAGAIHADPTVGAAGPRIERPDGTRYPSARSFPSMVDAAGHGFLGLLTTENPFSRRYLRPDAENTGPVDWVSGACVAVRRHAFESVGGFDEGFFMFLEDVDLCWRLSLAGWSVQYVADGRVVHQEGVSRASAPYRMIVAHHRSLLRYGMRTTTGRDRWWLPLIALGLVVRTGLLFFRQAVRGGRRGSNPRQPVV